MVKMKHILLLVLVSTYSVVGISQELLGRKDAQDWFILSSSPRQQQLKKIDQDRFIAYYRTTMNDASLNVYDSKLNVIKSIGLTLTDYKKGWFGGTHRAAYPLFIYQKESNSVTFLGKKESGDGWVVVGVNVSLESGAITGCDTLKRTESNEISIQLSKDEQYILVEELLGKDKKQYAFNVFDCKCKKMYDYRLDFPKKAENYSIVNNKGEVVQCFSDRGGRQQAFCFTQKRNKGEAERSITFAPSKDDIYDYEVRNIVQAPDGSSYCVMGKKRNRLEGFSIVKLDFVKGKSEVVSDSNLDKEYLKSLYAGANQEYTMTEKKLKGITNLDRFSVSEVYADVNGFYILMESLLFEVSTRSALEYFTHEDAIVLHVDLNGKLKWGVPIDRKCYTLGAGGSYNANGQGGKINCFDDERFLYLLVPSIKKVFATRIDKETGEYAKPILVFDEKDYYTNYSTVLWLDGSTVVLTTGVYSAFTQRAKFLNSVRLKY